MMIKRSVIMLLHIAYWLLYLLLITIFVAAANHSNIQHSFRRLLWLLFASPMALSAMLPAVLSFYSFYSILFSRFLQRKKFVQLSLAAFIVIALTTALPVSILAARAAPGVLSTGGELAAVSCVIAIICFIHGVIALVLRGFIAWYGDIRLKEQLSRKNHEMEMALLHSQLNPHFLFNTLNNIDVLIEKDPVKASGYLNRLSDIMRFMLYETRSGRIPLAKELTYIGKYIDLQKIRTSNPNYVSYVVEGDPKNLMIEPMLFIPFIENAFKHGEDRKREEAIRIRFCIQADTIVFDCENRYNAQRPSRPDNGGLGNDLIKKRLMLLYPGTHRLEVDAAHDLYKAKLTLHGNN